MGGSSEREKKKFVDSSREALLCRVDVVFPMSPDLQGLVVSVPVRGPLPAATGTALKTAACWDCASYGDETSRLLGNQGEGGLASHNFWSLGPLASLGLPASPPTGPEGHEL